MIRSRLVILGIAILMSCLLAIAGACTQQGAPTPSAIATDIATDAPEATPTLEPTDRAAPPPTIQPTDTPTSTPTTQPTDTPEAAPTPPPADMPEAVTTASAPGFPLDCMDIAPTYTPDSNLPEGVRNVTPQTWDFSSYEEAECITGYTIYVPTNLPDGFVREEIITAGRSGTERFQNRFVGQSWYMMGNQSYSFVLEQHSWDISLGQSEPADINGIPGERLLLPEHPPDSLPLLALRWGQGGYWFTISGFLHGPITEDFLLEIAASLEPRDKAPASQTTVVPPECLALDPTSTPDPNRPEGIRGKLYEFWNVSSFEEAECITDYPIAVPTNLPDGFVRAENIIVHKSGTSHFEDRFVEHFWNIPGDPPYGFMLSQHSWKFSLGDSEPALINGIPGERHLRPAIPPDFPPLLVFLWEEDGYWFTISGFLHGPITEEFLLEVAASLEFRENGTG